MQYQRVTDKHRATANTALYTYTLLMRRTIKKLSSYLWRLSNVSVRTSDEQLLTAVSFAWFYTVSITYDL